MRPASINYDRKTYGIEVLPAYDDIDDLNAREAAIDSVCAWADLFNEAAPGVPASGDLITFWDDSGSVYATIPWSTITGLSSDAQAAAISAAASDATAKAGAAQGAAEATAAAALSGHVAAADPHAQYQKEEAGKGLSTNDYDNAEKAKVPTAAGKTAAEALAAHELAVVLDKREICFGNGININAAEKIYGDIYASTVLGCTPYIDCYKAKQIVITMPVLTSTPSQGLVFYDADKVAIAGAYVLRLQGAASGSEVVTIDAEDIPATARYFRTTYWNYPQMQTLAVEFAATIYYADDFSDGRHPRYRPYQAGMINFAVHVNQGVSNAWGATADNQEPESFKASTSALFLPDEYDPNGLPVKTILFFGGLSRGVRYGLIGDLDGVDTHNDEYAAMMESFRTAGYAVLLCNGPRDNPNVSLPLGAACPKCGCPQDVNAHHQSYLYTLEHYNILPEIYVIGASAGGLAALNYCFSHQNVRAMAMLSTWTDAYLCGWMQSTPSGGVTVNGVREEFMTYFGITDITVYESAKVQGHDPQKRILTIATVQYLPYSKHPIKAWLGATETGALATNLPLFITALKNANSNAQLRTVAGVGHENTYGGSAVVIAEVITWLAKQ